MVGDGNDLNMDVDAVEPLITERTKAVIPVHWAGYRWRSSAWWRSATAAA